MFRAGLLLLLVASVLSAVAPCTDCGGYGVCQVTTTCRCFAARFSPTVNGTKQTYSCASTILLNSETSIQILRSVVGIFNGLVMLLIAWRLYLEYRMNNNKEVARYTPGREVKFSLIVVLIITASKCG